MLVYGMCIITSIIPLLLPRLDATAASRILGPGRQPDGLFTVHSLLLPLS
jgi:hypothetical protein